MEGTPGRLLLEKGSTLNMVTYDNRLILAAVIILGIWLKG